MKHQKGFHFNITLSYIILFLGIPITFLFSYMMGNKLNNYIEETIDNAAVLCTDMVEQQYENDMLLMESLSMRMSASLATDPKSGMDRLVSTAKRYGMLRIAFSTPDGFTYSTDDAQMELQGVDNFERALRGEILLTPVIEDEAGSGEINVYSVPVFREGTKEIVGVLSAVYSSDVYKNILAADSFDGEGYTYIIDNKGNVVIRTSHRNAIPGIANIFDYIEKYNGNEEEAVILEENLQRRNKGFLDINDEAGGRFACYIPLSMNNWFLVSVVPKSVAEVTKNAVMYGVIIYCICISAVAVFLVWSIRQSQKERNLSLEKALYVDEITGGRTYAKFCKDCRKRLDWRANRRVACAFFDIDNFNLVSSLYGNDESNQILREIYELIQQSVGEDGYVARNGSSQFVMMYFFNEIEETQERINAFNLAFYQNPRFKNMLRPSLGVYFVEDWDESVDVMINKAKIAQETIRQNAEKHVVYYDESYRNALFEDKNFEKEMEKALANEEFVPYLQPKYNAATGEICGAEALIRWITPDGTLISPGKFIPLAENNGFIRMLDRAMFHMVCQIQKDLVSRGIQPVPVSVNVSRQLMYDAGFADDYCNLMTELGLSPDMVELEITESAFFEDLKLFRDTLEKLRNYGFRILMDDFGTGYSSLMMLKSVPIDVIKLDKSFVDDYNDEKGRNIIGCVLDLAKKMQLPVVAEGVETEQQYEYLRDMGCDSIQGFYFSRPLPLADYVQKLA